VKVAWGAVHKLKPFWNCKIARDDVKERLFDCFVRTAIAFSCQAWVMTQRQRQRLNVAFTRMRRTAFGISKFQDDTYTRCTPLREIYRWRGPVGERNFAQPISSTILFRRLSLLGHVLRRDVPLRDALRWEPTGQRLVGGRRRSLFDAYLLDLPEEVDREIRGGSARALAQKTPTSRVVDFDALIAFALRRDEWEAMVVRVVNKECHRYILHE